MTPIALRLLGPVRLETPSGVVVPHAGRVSTLLALLGMEVGRVVSVDRVMHELWGDEPPGSGRSTLYVYVSRLRSQLEDTPLRITARAPGYVLEAPREAIDAHVFTDLVAVADEHAARERWPEVLAAVVEAQRLWRDDPFTDTLAGDDLDNEAKRLVWLAERADELAARALLALDRPDEASRRAESLIRRDAFNETYWRLRLRAEHADGRTAAALASFEEFRRLLADELGIDPSESLRALHLEILRSTEDTAGAAAVAPPPSAAAPVAAPTEPAAPPVGRAAERAVLDTCVDEGLAGRGRLVVLAGEAGIGKTRLAEHAADRAQRAGARVVWARAIDGAGTPPLWVWEQVVGEVTGGVGADALRSLAEQDAGASPEQAPFRLYERIVGTVLDAVAAGPLLLVLDDLQWADAGTLQALGLLVPRLRSHACSVVVTARPRPSHETDPLTTLDRDPQVSRLWLEPLSPDDVDDLATSLGETADDPALLWERSGGNPFLLIAMLRDRSGAEVPASVGELFDQRLAALPSVTRDLLDLAAVAGRTIDPLLLARATGVTVLDVVRELEPARQDGLVVNDRATRGLTFVHDLARDAIATRVAPVDAVALHARIADAIAEVHAEDLADHVDELADHRFAAAAGAPSPEAFEACQTAADHAASRLAYDQAALHRGRALASLATGEADRPQRFEVLLALTSERRSAGDVVGASASLRQAIELARRMADPALLRRAVTVLGGVTLWNWRHFAQVDRDTVQLIESILDSPEPMPDADRAALLGTLAVELYYGDDPARCAALASEAVEIARRVGDPALLGRTLNNYVIALWYPSRSADRRDALDESLALVDRGLPQTTEVVARLHRAPLHVEVGDIASFEENLAHTDWLAGRLGRPELEGQIASQWMSLAMLRGEIAVAAEAVDRSYRLLSSTSLWGADWVRLVMLTCLARAGGPDAVPADLTDTLVTRASEDAYRTLRWSAVLALAHDGRLDEARAMQARWGLTSMPHRLHWGTGFEWCQAAEAALLLDAPAAADAYDRLRSLDSPLVAVGTGPVWGPVDSLLARLADRLGDAETAERHRESAAAVDVHVAEALGRTPVWPISHPATSRVDEDGRPRP